MDILGSLCLILIFSLLGGYISSRLNFPSVIGQLLAGILIGPSVLNLVQSNQILSSISEVGVVMLMFIAGLESNISLLRKFFTPSIIVAISGMAVPFGLIYLIGQAFKLPNATCIFLGVTFAATSVSISAVVLKEMNSLDTDEGSVILAAAVVDDILSVLLLSLIGPSENNVNSIPVMLMLQLGYFALLFFFSRWMMPLLFRIFNKSDTVLALIICLFFAYFANLVGLSSVIGAFFAGIAIGQTKFAKKVGYRVNLIASSIFIPVFFTSIGLKMTLNGIINDFGLFIALTLGGIISKLLGAGIGARISGFSNKSSIVIGSGMVSRGEMALIIAQIGIQNKLLSSERYSAVVGAIVMTTVIAPFLLRSTIRLNDRKI
ncbi:cation:proton antiporter [Xylocopilactobacillus apis]|uniref:Sodium:proton antiporter n=1 Tax=Xylocopilactobacillus apis TaxID=2932183 RepID=A0AAU9D2C5_9LACO|nr:cation:proton antiporter [Xylocopilactobacillus apis]BDR56636.1 sodium:proton antiporter [Xylocopilactobacillus apis]